MSCLTRPPGTNIVVDLSSTLFGGPSQPEPEDERGGIKAAERMARESPSVINPNQYGNDNVSLESYLFTPRNLF